MLRFEKKLTNKSILKVIVVITILYAILMIWGYHENPLRDGSSKTTGKQGKQCVIHIPWTLLFFFAIVILGYESYTQGEYNAIKREVRVNSNRKTKTDTVPTQFITQYGPSAHKNAYNTAYNSGEIHNLSISQKEFGF